MRRILALGGKWRMAGAACLVLLVIGGAGWIKRADLLAWYYVQGLERADEKSRDAWINPILPYDRAAVPRLTACLQHENDRGCANAQHALTRLVDRWGTADERTQELAERLVREFVGYSSIGQESALDVNRAMVRRAAGQPLGNGLATPLVAMLVPAAKSPNAGVRGRALQVAEALLAPSNGVDVSVACREMTQLALHDECEDNRTQAIRLAAQPALQMLNQLLPLAKDANPAIRRAALLAIGQSPDLLSTDELLHWLHDPNADVRHVCEGCLRARGLREDHVRMGRMMTDERAMVRVQVLEQLCRNAELEPGVWLRRMSHDPAPAVRAATIRMSAEQTLVDLSDRMEQMAQDDPSLTVRALAQYYLSRPKPN